MAKGYNFNRLYIFHLIAEVGSIEKAAAHLGKCTSSISEMMKRFENNDIKKKLFKRVYKGLEVTPDGQALRDETYWFFREADKISDRPFLTGLAAETVAMTVHVPMSNVNFHRAPMQ